MPNSFWTDLLAQLDGSLSDLIIVAFIGLFIVYHRSRDQMHKEQIEKLEARHKEQLDKLEGKVDARFSSANDRHKDSSDKLWSKIDELRNRSDDLKGKYHQLDKGVFGMAKIIQVKHPEVKLIKQSANGSGDYALDRSEE